MLRCSDYMKTKVPSFDELLNPTMEALKHLGGSASIDELVAEIVRRLGVPQEIAEIPHPNSGRTELEYRSAWARTYLRKVGLIENSDRGVWALTPKGSQIESVDGRQIARDVARQFSQKRSKPIAAKVALAADEQLVTWQDKLLTVLRSMDPIAFERLCQRLLRESGFIEVEVTKRSGDRGIDGYGTIRLGGLISFNVLFQSKRQRKNIGPRLFATSVERWLGARTKASSSVQEALRSRPDERRRETAHHPLTLLMAFCWQRNSRS